MVNRAGCAWPRGVAAALYGEGFALALAGNGIAKPPATACRSGGGGSARTWGRVVAGEACGGGLRHPVGGYYAASGL